MSTNVDIKIQETQNAAQDTVRLERLAADKESTVLATNTLGQQITGPESTKLELSNRSATAMNTGAERKTSKKKGCLYCSAITGGVCAAVILLPITAAVLCIGCVCGTACVAKKCCC